MGGVVEGSGAIVVDRTGDVAVVIDVSGTMGPQATADPSAGIVIAPFADTLDLEGKSKLQVSQFCQEQKYLFFIIQ